MKKESIKQIEEDLSAVKDALASFRKSQSTQRSLDDIVRHEDTLRDQIEGCSYILSQLSFLTRSHKLFSRVSTYEERTNLSSWLKSLASYLENGNFSGIETQLGEIERLIRNYKVFLNKEYISDFHDELNKLAEKNNDVKTQLETSQKLLKESKENKEKYDNLVNELQNKQNELGEAISNLNTAYDELNTKVKNAEASEEEISELLTRSKSHAEVITNFSERVENRENQLDKQKTKTEEYTKKLGEYQTEHEAILQNAQQLIESARKALNYKTAEGISAAIQTQYEKAKSKVPMVFWLASAFIFVLITVVLGALIAFDSYIAVLVQHWLKLEIPIATAENNLALVIARIALLPVTIAGAVFCAQQFTKQKNLSEDYAYKMVLTKSIVGFSEQLLKVKDTNEAYLTYVEKVFEELLQDPLRQRKVKDKVVENRAKDMVASVYEVLGQTLKINKDL